ncbi:Tc toxin subunit A [Edaphovirga cremea]|uniref:Tc toxin subunit A n=1 Tax=Edaphovirga cremea TaxID=2267246 RepID=UPI00398A1931
MTQQNFVSPFITRIEDVYQLNNALREAGYQSVFDVIRVPRKQFISQHAGHVRR